MNEKPRILVVDDEPRAVELLVRSLRKLAHVSTAATANEALPLVMGQGFDLVLSDQRMPGMSGVELLTRIAEIDEQVGRVLLTGYTDLDTCVEAINRGRVHAFLHKPCSPPDLLATVTGVLQRVRLARDHARLVAVVTEQNHQLEEALVSLRSAQDKLVASERLAAIGRMIAMIVHDLRSPLSTIESAGAEVSRIAKAATDAPLAELGNDVVQECERLNRMCSALLEISRASELRLTCSIEPLDDALEDTLAPLYAEASDRAVELVLDLGSEATVALDRDAFRRAVQNLTRNAFEAMPSGGTLRVETRCQDTFVLVAMTDSGAGVPPEITDRVFEPFVTFGKSNGSGLGLAIVRKIIDEMGGSIALCKADGGGARFEIRLPIVTPEAA